MVAPAKSPRSSYLGWYEEYHPYGSTAWWASNAAITVSRKRYRYTGMERDEETGLQCHGVRYYAPWLGRWTSADPIGLGDGGNRFTYVHGDPNRRMDPTGTVGTEDANDDDEAPRTGFSNPDGPNSLRVDAMTGYFSDPIAKSVIRHYVFGEGRQVDLTADETKSLGLVLVGPNRLRTLASEMGAPGVREGQIELDSVKLLGYSRTPGTTAEFAGRLAGKLTLLGEGAFRFEGTAQMIERIDYDPFWKQGQGHRSFEAEAFVIAAQPFLAGGRPYTLTTQEIPIMMEYAPGRGWNVSSTSDLVFNTSSHRPDLSAEDQVRQLTMGGIAPQTSSPYAKASIVGITGGLVGAVIGGRIGGGLGVAGGAVVGATLSVPVGGVALERAR